MSRCPHCGHEFEDGGLLSVESDAEVLYKLYPRKVAKPAALRAIRSALRKTPFTVLHKKAVELSEMWRGHDTMYLPYPASWYNSERFNDTADTWLPRNGSPKPITPLHVLIRQLTEAIERHPANPQFVAYEREKVTSAMREELKAWRGKLEQLQKLQMQAIT